MDMLYMAVSAHLCLPIPKTINTDVFLNFHHLDFVTYGHKCVQADTKVDANHVQRALEAGASRCEGCK